jgi:hypothetical protein
MQTFSRRSALLSAACNLSELDPDQLLVETETATWTRCSPRTLESWRRDGFGPKWLKLGRSVCYRVRDLRDWLAAQECGARPYHRRSDLSARRRAKPESERKATVAYINRQRGAGTAVIEEDTGPTDP